MRSYRCHELQHTTDHRSEQKKKQRHLRYRTENKQIYNSHSYQVIIVLQHVLTISFPLRHTIEQDSDKVVMFVKQCLNSSYRCIKI